LLVDALGRAGNSGTTWKRSCLREACWLIPFCEYLKECAVEEVAYAGSENT